MTEYIIPPEVTVGNLGRLAHGNMNRLFLSEAANELERLLTSGAVLPDHVVFNVRGTMYLLRHEMWRV